MVKQASLFSQLLCLVDRHHFEREVRRLEAERHAKGFSCWGQFVAMMFCQLAQAKSLREIVDGLACCEGKLRHLGLENGPGVQRSVTPMHTALGEIDGGHVLTSNN